MTENEFQKLIRRSEGETLDFKEDGYDLKNSRNKFIKDVLAMANTPREQPAYIVFGVRWTPESGSTVVGLERQLDDVELQHKFGENLVQPIPRFTYIPLRFEGKQVGVLEIPVGKDGPYGPITDQDKKRQDSSSYDERLQAGAVYYRRGSQNARAMGTELKQIVTWFLDRDSSILEDQETDSWRHFLEAVHRFEPGTTYLLAVDRISSKTAAPVHALGMPPWRAVIDFDPDSEASGFLSCIAGTLGSQRVIHRVVRSQHEVQPEPGTHWFFARGLSGRQDTVSEGDHNTWLKAYKQELGRQLERVAGAVSPSPVVALILWSDVHLRHHLRTLMEELHGAFGEALEIVFVANDEASFAELAENVGATFVRMNLRSLCSGVAVHYADLHGGDDERYILPSLSGASVEVAADDWLWLSEDLDLVHRSIGLAGDDDAKEYRRGADITWRNLHLHHDCDRDIMPMVRSQIEADLRRRQTVRINIYHAPGSGGTTVGRRVAWDLHNTFPVGILRKCTPSDTSGRIAKVAALTETSSVVVVDGGQHSEREVDNLYDLLKAGQTPVVLLQVLRRFQSQDSGGKRQFWLDAPLTNAETDRFRDAYTRAAPEKNTALAQLAGKHNNQQRNAFFFGLTAFGKNFRGLHPYVQNRIAGLTDNQQRILAYIAVAHYYGQQSVPAQAFASLLGLPLSRRLDLKAAFSNEAARALELLIVNPQAEWRTAHHLIAHEIMQQILAPKGSQEYEAVWRQNLSSWGEDFASFCQGDEGPTSDRLLELVRRVFIYRDNVEVLGTERAAQKQFAQLIDDIPSPQGRTKVLQHLTDCFPLEAHFYAHLGRLLSLSGEHDRALDCLDRALSLQQDDQVLHHMRGMMLRQNMKAKAEENAPISRLTEIAKEASESFEEARRLQPDQEHGYISEVQMLISLVDEVWKDKGKDVMRDVLAQPNTDPFLKGALEKAEDLLDRVHHLYVGEQPSRYVLDCRARLQRFYGDYQTALQSWDNMLSRPEVAKPPVRRQIVWTILRRGEGDWNKISKNETERIRRLLEENLEEDINDSTSLRLWLRAIRQSQTPPSLDSVIERVSYWKANTGALDAAYYLYVLHMLRALKGSSQGAADAERALEECRVLARLRRDRTRSFEWIGPGDGISTLVHQSRLGDWAEDFWESADALTRLDGRISSIDGPQKGSVELSGGVKAFLVPAKSGFQAGRDENAPVSCYLGFSYEGPRAWMCDRPKSSTSAWATRDISSFVSACYFLHQLYMSAKKKHFSRLSPTSGAGKNSRGCRRARLVQSAGRWLSDPYERRVTGLQESRQLTGGLEIPPRQRGERSLAVGGAEPTEAKAKEVLVLDSSTFIREIGLTSQGASALKHYLYHRGTRLVVPQVVAEECERNLTTIVRGKKEKIEEQLRWLGRFFGSVSGWPGPSDDAIEQRAKVLAHAEHLTRATVLPELEIIRKRAEARNQAERPPSHKRPGLSDCRIWEQCLALLADHNVVFVSDDGDFCGHRRPDELHPQLQAETEEVGAGRRLTFHPNMASLLSELRTERPSIPKEAVFAFVYDELADIKELEANSGCRHTATGDVKQTLFTTDQDNILEVRLEVDDQWKSPDGTKVHDFQLHGSCHYRLADNQLCDFTVSNIKLLTTEPDGTVRAVKGSYINIAGTIYAAGAPPIKPEPEILE